MAWWEDRYNALIGDEDEEKEETTSSWWSDRYTQALELEKGRQEEEKRLASQRAAEEQEARRLEQEQEKKGLKGFIKTTGKKISNTIRDLRGTTPEMWAEEIQKAPQRYKEFFTGKDKEKNVDEAKLKREMGEEQYNEFMNMVREEKEATEKRIEELEKRRTLVDQGQFGFNQYLPGNKEFLDKQATAIEEAKKAYEKDTGLKAEDSELYKELTTENEEMKKIVSGDDPEKQIEQEKEALEDYNNFLENNIADRGFVGSLLETVKDPKNVIPFIKDIEQVGGYTLDLAVIKKYGRGEELTVDELARLNKIRAKTLEKYIENGMGSKVGELVGSMPKYALEFALTSGLFTAGKVGATRLTGEVGKKILVKEAAKELGEEGIKFTMKENAIRLTAGLIGSAVQTVGFIPTIANNTAEYMLPEYDLVAGENGDAVLEQIDGGDSFMKALTKAGLMSYVEVATERAGFLVEDPMDFMKRSILSRYATKMGVNDATTLNKIAKAIGWNGIIAEVFEEELGEIFQAPIEEREYYAPLLTPEGTERLLVETLGITAFGGFARVVGSVTDSKGNISKDRKMEGDVIDISDVGVNVRQESEEDKKLREQAEEYVASKDSKYRGTDKGEVTYYYHGTPASNLDSIREKGLVRGQFSSNMEGFVQEWGKDKRMMTNEQFLKASEEEGNNATILRVNEDLLDYRPPQEGVTEKIYASTKTILPNQLEVSTDGGKTWQSLDKTNRESKYREVTPMEESLRSRFTENVFAEKALGDKYDMVNEIISGVMATNDAKMITRANVMINQISNMGAKPLSADLTRKIDKLYFDFKRKEYSMGREKFREDKAETYTDKTSREKFREEGLTGEEIGKMETRAEGILRKVTNDKGADLTDTMDYLGGGDLKGMLLDFTRYSTINDMTDSEMGDLVDRFIEVGKDTLISYRDNMVDAKQMVGEKGVRLEKNKIEEFRVVLDTLKRARNSGRRVEMAVALDSLISEEHARGGSILAYGYDFGDIDRASELIVRTLDYFRNQTEYTAKQIAETYLDKRTSREKFREGGVPTSKLLEEIKDKEEVSRKHLENRINSSDLNLKQVEKDIATTILNNMKGDMIDVEEFSNDMRSEFIPLKFQTSQVINKDGKTVSGGVYEFVTLPENKRGNVSNYYEKVYASPINVGGLGGPGDIHFSHFSNAYADYYFGHTRIEDMALEKRVPKRLKDFTWAIVGEDGVEHKFKTSEEALDYQTTLNEGSVRRIIELQTDLYQKGRVEEQINLEGKQNLTREEIQEYSDKGGDRDFADMATKTLEDKEARIKELEKLKQYNNPTAHFRMAREEIRQAAIDGKTTLLFPVGDTAMRIEGLSSEDVWFVEDANEDTGASQLTEENMEVGKMIAREAPGDMPGEMSDQWIITEILGDGKFKAVDSFLYERFSKPISKEGTPNEYYELIGALGYDAEDMSYTEERTNDAVKEYISKRSEAFDISGKGAENHPIHRFYEKDLGKYLKSKYQATRFTDENGVDWWKVDIKPEQATTHVEAFRVKDDVSEKLIKGNGDGVSKVLKKGTVLYHGTSVKAGKNIKATSFKMGKGQGGFFGDGAYLTPSKRLAKLYADEYIDGIPFRKGTVLNMKLKEDVRLYVPTEQEIDELIANDRILDKRVSELLGNEYTGFYIKSDEYNLNEVVIYDQSTLNRLEVYRVKDDFEKRGIKITDDQERQIIELNKKFFNDGDIRIVEQIVTNPRALGSYLDGVIKILNGRADMKDTYYHEAVHKYLDIFLTREEQVNLLLEAQKKYGGNDFAQIEENLAEDFIKYAKSREGITGKIKVIFDQVLERINAYIGHTEEINKLYTDIVSGKAKKLTKTAERKTAVRGKGVTVGMKPKKVTTIASKKKTTPAVKRPVGKGEELTSRFQERVQEELLSTDPSRYEFNELTGTYNKLTLEDDAKKAVNYMVKNPEKAVGVSLGLIEAPRGHTANAIAKATALRARQEGNIKLYAEIINSTSQRATRMGQELVTLRGTVNDDSADAFIRRLIDKKMELVGKRLVTDAEKGGKKLTNKQKVTTKINERVAQESKKVSADQGKIKLAQDIIDSLRC